MARRRANKEGSIYPEGDKWRAQIKVDESRISRTFLSKKEAAQWLKMIGGQVERGLTLAGIKTPMSDFLLEWLKSVASNLRPDTASQYRQVVRDHVLNPQLKRNLARTRVGDLNGEHVQALLNELADREVGARTRQVVYTVLHAALDHGMRLGMAFRNPVDLVKKPKYVHGEMQILTSSQASALLLAVRGTLDEALYFLAVTTGMRQGELLGLMWQDVDWKNGNIKICRQSDYSQSEGGHSFPSPKTKAGRRKISLGSGIEVVRTHYNLQQRVIRTIRSTWKDHGLVFPSMVGTPKNPSNLDRQFKALLKDAGLPAIRFHDLRHTAVSLMIAAGQPINVISRRIGHSSPGFTLNQYSHLLPDQDLEAAEAMYAMVRPVEVELNINCTEIARNRDDSLT